MMADLNHMMSKTTKIMENRKHKREKIHLQKYSRLSYPIFAPTTLQSMHR